MRIYPDLSSNRDSFTNINKKNCSICLDDIDDDEKFLLCSHTFHSKCIIKWTKRQFINKSDNYLCPLCKDPYNIKLMITNIFDYKLSILDNYIYKLRFLIRNYSRLTLKQYLSIRKLLYNYYDKKKIILNYKKRNDIKNKVLLIEIEIEPIPDNINYLINIFNNNTRYNNSCNIL